MWYINFVVQQNWWCSKLRLEFYVIILLLDHHNNVLIVFFHKCTAEYERTHARTRMYQMFNFKDAHAFTNDLLSTFSKLMHHISWTRQSVYVIHLSRISWETLTRFAQNPCFLTSHSDLQYLLSRLHLALDWRWKPMHMTSPINWVSNSIHLTQTQQCDGKMGS